MKRYAIFFCKIGEPLRRFYFVTCIQAEDWDEIPGTIGDVVFYFAETTDEKRNTDPSKLDWYLEGLNERLKHATGILYLLMDQ